MLCSHVWEDCIFMRVLFEKLTRIIRVLQYLLDVLPQPLCCRIRHSIHTPCFALLFCVVSDIFLDFSPL